MIQNEKYLVEHDRGFLPVEAVATKLHGVCADVKSINDFQTDQTGIGYRNLSVLL